jgi:hypothetical protein
MMKRSIIFLIAAVAVIGLVCWLCSGSGSGTVEAEAESGDLDVFADGITGGAAVRVSGEIKSDLEKIRQQHEAALKKSQRD